MSDDISDRLEKRLGRTHARQRLDIENENEQRVFGGGLNFFHIENWYSVHSLIRLVLQLSGLYWRGRRNAASINIQHNDVKISALPQAFHGYTILQISDMHVDRNEAAVHRLIELLHEIDYDACVLTGDYRGKTYGPIEQTLEGMALVRAHLKDPIYGVLGNHDTIRMLPGLEDIGIRLLLNESVMIERQSSRIHFSGIDDAHYYRVDNIEKAAAGIPANEVSILLSHTPEIYHDAANANFDLLLGGHTHGGQICLPGGIPITLDSSLPRYMGSGSWQYQGMLGYTSVGMGTSVVTVRLNCLPEITLHHLRS